MAAIYTVLSGKYPYAANSQLTIQPNPATEYIIVKGLAGTESIKMYDGCHW